MSKMLALNDQGMMTYCTVDPELRGTGKCNHIAHQGVDESAAEFVERVNNDASIFDKKENVGVTKEEIDSAIDTSEDTSEEISQEEIDNYASRIDEIAGTKVTEDNYEEVMSKLTPDQVSEITNIAFDAAPKFSLPVSDEDYEDVQTSVNIEFAQLPKYGIAGNQGSIEQMFENVGQTPIIGGDIIDVNNSYKEGLTPHEYFAREFSARDAMVSKTVAVSRPGYSVWRNQKVLVEG